MNQEGFSDYSIINSFLKLSKPNTTPNGTYDSNTYTKRMSAPPRKASSTPKVVAKQGPIVKSKRTRDQMTTLRQTQPPNCVSNTTESVYQAVTQFIPKTEKIETKETDYDFDVESAFKKPKRNTENKIPEWITREIRDKFMSDLSKWKLGDPLPVLKPEGGWLEMIGDCKEVTEMHPERRKRFEEFTELLGDAGRNQLAMGVEYMAQIKLVSNRIEHMFEDSQSEKFNMKILPESELYYDPTEMESSFMGNIFVVFMGTEYPNEETWKKTLKIHHHMIEVQKVNHKIYFPANRTIRDKIPSKYRLDTQMFECVPDTRDKESISFVPHATEINKIQKRYNISNEDLRDFCFEEYDKLNKLTQSEYWNYFFGHVKNNGSNHLVLSDSFDYSTGKPEVLKERVIFRNKGDPKNIKNWFSGDSSIWSNKKSTHVGLPCPHYAIPKYIEENGEDLMKNLLSSTGNQIDSKTRIKTENDKNREHVIDNDNNVVSKTPKIQEKPNPFKKHPDEDDIVGNKLRSTSILSDLDSKVCFLNGLVLFGTNVGFKDNLSTQLENLKNLGIQIPCPPPNKNLSVFQIADALSSRIIVWRIKLNMSTVNYHNYFYKSIPPKHPFEKEIREEVLKQRRRYNCLSPLNWGECFTKPPNYVEGDSLLPPLITENDQKEFDELGIEFPLEIVPRNSNDLIDVVNTLNLYKSDHWYLPSNTLELNSTSPMDSKGDRLILYHKSGFSLPKKTRPKKPPNTGVKRKPISAVRTNNSNNNNNKMRRKRITKKPTTVAVNTYKKTPSNSSVVKTQVKSEFPTSIDTTSIAHNPAIQKPVPSIQRNQKSINSFFLSSNQMKKENTSTP